MSEEWRLREKEMELADKIAEFTRVNAGSGSSNAVVNLIDALLWTGQSAICGSLDLGNMAMIRQMLDSRLVIMLVGRMHRENQSAEQAMRYVKEWHPELLE